ncbi:alkane 1-monooxygenase [Oleiagrimonas soli]|uniref:Alkane 1-monooxygenase n=1 Tax=Oleiagrimonas soli TaxID=1543381 RepID=A0A099CVF7_9GAMM|nr:alkane 1-monooxygenase [Oleiagrimonas soli]KGI77582.1 alkane 1-monooxygenase [Oleiagrimonas soli]MBB6182930.1 alkane 1-monooxygenase [Oleiagrimonas soli]
MRVRDFGYLAVFLTAALPLLAWALIHRDLAPDLAAWLPLAVVYGVVPLLDLLLGEDPRNPIDDAQAQRLDAQRWFRVLTWLCVPVWLALLAFCMRQATTLPLHPLGQLGWLLSTGTIGGVLAINVAHELIHKAGRLEPVLGGIALTSVGYFGFKIEHLRGHHVHVGTPEDVSSARLGESVYPFVLRALLRNPRAAWRLEAERLQRRGQGLFTWHNEMLRWSALWLSMLTASALWAGLAGALFFVAQGLIAAATLEVINYVEHYGLRRARDAQGRYERVTHLHSWNASQRLTNWLLFQLQRHSDHHAHARRRYQVLRHHADSPQLPTGYAGMFVLALVPPLWRRLMDERVRHFNARNDLGAQA